MSSCTRSKGCSSNVRSQVIKQSHDQGFAEPLIWPKVEVTEQRTSRHETEAPSSREFTDEQISRTTRLARKHAFESFDSERGENATYGDSRFIELQSFMGMVGCVTAQGAARFQYRRGTEYGSHGDTHLRAVKQFGLETLLGGFDEATGQVLSEIESEAAFHRPVTAAIDVTTLPYYSDVEGMGMVSGTKLSSRS